MSNLFNQSDIVKKLQRYCVYQDRCHKDVVDKMKLMKIPYSLHDNVIVELIKDDFLNEKNELKKKHGELLSCLLYTSDAADE